MHTVTIEAARDALRRSFGYDAFRPGQEQAVRSVLAGRDTLVILPTGGGKSLCFQVPALLLPGLTVVVSPLISLMKDQVDALTTRGLPATFVNSTLSSSQVADRLGRAMRGDVKLLYLAPERFDLGTTAERLRDAGVSLLAVDEAHCISEWGHDFRPSYLRVREVRERLGDPPTIALTATATPEVRRDIARQLALRDPDVVITGFDRRNLRYHVVPAKNETEKDAALAAVLKAHQGVAVVYASTRKTVERVTQVLDTAGLSVVGYHAGLDDGHRRDVQDAFMNERARVIVATNAFGMGIDKPNVRLVVHHAMPGTLEAYYQEAGRAGRDGNQSDCYLLHSFPDRFTHEFFIKGAYPERATVNAVYDLLRRRADATGLSRSTPDDLAASLPGKISSREVESALRILGAGSAVASEPESISRAHVRLIARPERVRRELGEERQAERELLRSLWRAAGKSLEVGAVVDLDGLPPGFGGAQRVASLLDWLQDGQFVVWQRTGGGLRLLRPQSAFAALSIDWPTIDRRRAGDLAKLDAMQKYAYTPGCRRSFVLRYFGDPAARPKCEGCDNCLGIRHDALTASEPSRRARPKPSPGRPATRRRGGAEGVSGETGTVVEPGDAPLFEALRTLRSALARDAKVPAYVIFPDRTLAEMAVRRPRTLAALGDIRGVGPVKLERFGARFLELVRQGGETEAA